MKKSLAFAAAALLLALPCAGLAACDDGEDLPETPYGVWTGDGSVFYRGMDVEDPRIEVTVAEGDEKGELDCVAVMWAKYKSSSGSEIRHKGAYLQLEEEDGKAGRFEADEFSLNWSEQEKTLTLEVPGQKDPIALSYAPLPEAPTLPQGEFWGIVNHDRGLRIKLGNEKMSLVDAPQLGEFSLRRVGGYKVAVIHEEGQCILTNADGKLYGYLADFGEQGGNCGVSFSTGTMPEAPYHHFVDGECSECDKQQEKGEVSYDYEGSTVKITITPGVVEDVNMRDTEVSASSSVYDEKTSTYVDKVVSTGKTGKFEAGGTYSYTGNNLTLSDMAPGDSVKIRFEVANVSNVMEKYRLVLKCTEGTSFFSALNFSVSGANPKVGKSGQFAYSPWTMVYRGEMSIVELTIKLPIVAGDRLQNYSCSIVISTEAVQGNAYVEDFVPKA